MYNGLQSCQLDGRVIRGFWGSSPTPGVTRLFTIRDQTIFAEMLRRSRVVCRGLASGKHIVHDRTESHERTIVRAGARIWCQCGDQEGDCLAKRWSRSNETVDRRWPAGTAPPRAREPTHAPRSLPGSGDHDIQARAARCLSAFFAKSKNSERTRLGTSERVLYIVAGLEVAARGRRDRAT